MLAYAEGVNGKAMQEVAIDLLARVPAPSVVVPVQVLGELFRVLTRKQGRASADARQAILTWMDTCAVVDTSSVVLAAAQDLGVDHQIGIFDAIIIAAAAHHGCRMLLSEDLQDGFTWRMTTIANPFRQEVHPLVRALIL